MYAKLVRRAESPDQMQKYIPLSSQSNCVDSNSRWFSSMSRNTGSRGWADMNGKWNIFTVSSEVRLWHIEFHARFWRWRVLSLLHGDSPAQSPRACAFLVLILFLRCLPCSHFINFTYPVSISVSRGSYSSSVSLQVPVWALYIQCLSLSFLMGLSQVLQAKTPCSCSWLPLLLVLTLQIASHPVWSFPWCLYPISSLSHLHH